MIEVERKRRDRRQEKEKKVVLQKRDLDLFLWLLEMKFSSIEVLDSRFFSTKSSTLGGARNRIRALEKAGYLISDYGERGSSKKFYFSSMKAFKALEESCPNEFLVRPIRSLPNTTFSHDLLVIRSRLLLEKAGRARNWVSERKLKAIWADRGIRVEREFLPDAIYENKNGDKVAFELELSNKTYERYEKKVHKYMGVMESRDGFFDYTLFITNSKFQEANLKKLISPYKTKIFMQSFSELERGGSLKWQIQK